MRRKLLAWFSPAAIAALTLLTAEATAATETYRFTNWQGPGIAVRLYAPEQVRSTTPVVIVMHGASRDAPRYFDDWRAAADTNGFIVAVPEFDEVHFPGSAAYNLGNVFDAATGAALPSADWTFAAIEPLFDDIVDRTGASVEGYTLYGHSAGGQFVHRFLYFLPTHRVTRAIVANAGWYTMPDFGIDFPYGLDGSGLGDDDVRRVLGMDLVVLLGEADNDENGHKLRKTPEAELQGPHRLARGQAFYRVAKARALELGCEFGWSIGFVQGAEHSNAAMTPAAAGYIR